MATIRSMHRLTLAEVLRRGRTNRGDVLSDPIWEVRIGPRRDRPERAAFIREESGCIIWQGADNGRGHAAYASGPVYRSVIAYFFGPIPPEHEVHHMCNGGGMCCNPEHLRVLHRDDHRGTKLNAAQAAVVRRLAWADVPQAEIALEFGIKPCTVSLIKHGHRWPDAEQLAA